MPLDLVEQANKLGSAGLVPMRTVLLVDNWETALERARELGSDRLESENFEFHRRVELGFDDVFRHNQQRIVKVQLQENIWDTADLVFKAVQDLFGDKVSDVFVIPEEMLVQS
jgi:dTMP kinase